MNKFPEKARAGVAAEVRELFKMLGRMKDRCDFCDREAGKGDKLKRCGKCKSGRYCSPDCAANDWKAGHKQRSFEAVSLFKK